MSSKQIICNDLNLKADSKLSTEMFSRLLDDEEINAYKNENDIEKEHFDQGSYIFSRLGLEKGLTIN